MVSLLKGSWMKNINPMAVTQIRAAGTPMPGSRADKKLTKAQEDKRSKNDMIMETINKIEVSIHELKHLADQSEKAHRISALERHVILDILRQQFGAEIIESLMTKRAPHFGIEIQFKSEKVNDEQDNSNESNKGDTPISSPEGYEGPENYS